MASYMLNFIKKNMNYNTIMKKRSIKKNQDIYFWLRDDLRDDWRFKYFTLLEEKIK